MQSEVIQMRHVALTSVFLGLSALAFPAAAGTLEDATARGNLKICIVEGAPYALKTPGGRWIGHEIDVGERLASDFGLAANFVPVGYGEALTRLNKGDCDLVAASLAIEPDRLRQAWFTTPYGESDVAIVAKKGAARIADLDKPEVVIGAVRGTPAVDLVRARLPSANVEMFADLIAAERALDAGAVTGLAYKAPIPRLVAVKAPDRYELVEGEPLARTADAIAVRRGDADTLNLVNGWIEARKRDGFLTATSRYWLGTLDWMERLKPKAVTKK
jgi:polar amino acid transport system substrate-binding protein